MMEAGIGVAALISPEDPEYVEDMSGLAGRPFRPVAVSCPGAARTHKQVRPVFAMDVQIRESTGAAEAISIAGNSGLDYPQKEPWLRSCIRRMTEPEKRVGAGMKKRSS